MASSYNMGFFQQGTSSSFFFQNPHMGFQQGTSSSFFFQNPHMGSSPLQNQGYGGFQQGYGGFQQGTSSSSLFQNPHMFSFQSGGLDMAPGTSRQGESGGLDMAPGTSRQGGGGVSGQSNWVENAFAVFTGSQIEEPSPSNLIVGPVPGLLWNPGLSQDWSIEEEAILNQGLVRYADEPRISKYIKIASLLQDKNVRDVALRCQWMSKKGNVKRRKGKKSKDSKGKMADSSANVNINVPPSYNINAYSQATPSEANPLTSVIDAPIQQLLNQNSQGFEDIFSNFNTTKMATNVEQFMSIRNNIITIQDWYDTMVSKTPDVMSSMPPLKQSINEELVNMLVLNTNEALQQQLAGNHSQEDQLQQHDEDHVRLLG